MITGRPITRINQQIRDDLHKMVVMGASQADLIEALGLSRYIVTRLLHESNLKTRRSYSNQEAKQKRIKEFLAFKGIRRDGGANDGSSYHTRSNLKERDQLLERLCKEHPELRPTCPPNIITNGHLSGKTP